MISISAEKDINSNIGDVYFNQKDKMKIKKDINKKQKKLIFIFLSIIFIIIVAFLVLFFWKPSIKSIKIYNYDSSTDTVTMEIELNNFLFNTECYISKFKTNDFTNKEHVTAVNNKCVFETSLNDYYIYLNKVGNTNKYEYLLSDHFKDNIDIIVKPKKLYLAVDEEDTINATIISINDNDEKLIWEVDDPSVVSVDNGLVKALHLGSTTVRVKSPDGLEKTVDIIVTDLVSSPIINNSRAFLTCKQYSDSDSLLLDDILKTRIENAGYKTRAGVVEAARFLTLRFPYRVNYFIETGRLNSYDKISFVDGEGRFYHQGLYLSTSKYNILASSKNGPAMWGCDLKQDDGYIGANGFDCSGFVTWVLYNGGFDVKDTGAGYTDRNDDVSDLGESHAITMDFLKSGKIKAGDLIGSNGHAAIIAGIDDNHVYVAESLYHNTGVSLLTYSFEELTSITKFSYISLMDSVYLSDGNYTNIW